MTSGSLKGTVQDIAFNFNRELRPLSIPSCQSNFCVDMAEKISFCPFCFLLCHILVYISRINLSLWLLMPKWLVVQTSAWQSPSKLWLEAITYLPYSYDKSPLKKLGSSLSPRAEIRFLLLVTHRWPHPSLLLRSLFSVVDLQSCSEKFVTNMCLRGDEWLHNAGSITVSVVIAVYHPAFFKSVVRCLYFGLPEKSLSAVSSS